MELDLKYVYSKTPKKVKQIYLEHGKHVCYPKNCNIVSMNKQPEKSYYLKLGLCAYVHSGQDGINRAFGLLLPGSSFGENPSLLKKITSVNVTCITNSEVLEVPISIIEKLMLADEEFKYELMQNMMIKYKNMYEVLAYATSYNITQRLALFLRSYVQATEQKPIDGWYTLKPRLSHERISELVNANRVTITLLINYLKEIELVEVKDNLMLFSSQFISEEFISAELLKSKWNNIRQLHKGDK